MSAWVLLLFLAAPQASPSTALPADPIVASASGAQVTAGDLRQVLVARRLTGDPAQILSTMTVDGREAIARTLIESTLLAREARTAGIDKEPEVQRAIRWAVEQLLAEELVRRATAATDTSDAVLHAYFKEHEAAFRQRARVRTRHVVVKTRDEAESLRQQIVSGASVADLAKAHNIDGSRERAGDLGWVPRGVMVKAFEDALFSLVAGEISPVVQTSFGFHVIRAEEVDAGHLPAFADVKADVKRRVLDERVSELKRRVVDSAGVRVNRDALSVVQK